MQDTLEPKAVWALVWDDVQGCEQILSLSVEPGQVPAPMIATDPERLPVLRQVAARVSEQEKVKVRLVEWTRRTVVEEWNRSAART